VDITTLSGTATFAAGSPTATIPVQALSDSAIEPAETVTITVQPGAGYSVGTVNSATVRVLDRPMNEWRQAHFTAAELLDPNISGDAADPDADDLSNSEEYALLHDPRAPDEDLAETTWVNGRLTMTFRRAKAPTDVAVIAEGSTDLITWATTGIVEEVSRIDEGKTEKITVRLASQPPGTRGFLRVRITPTP
jgi:hypothetical protein